MTLMNIDNCQLEVRRISGVDYLSPIIFLHEGLGSVSSWAQQDRDWPTAVCAATGRAGIVYSRRGYGQSEAISAGRNLLQPDYMHREAWEVLPALLAVLKINNPVLLGHSDGATIALLYASRLKVSSCIALAPHVLIEDIAIKSITKAKETFESGNLRAQLAKHHLDVDGAFWQWNDVWLSQGFQSFNIRPHCQAITSPLLLIQGLNDAYGSMLQLDEIALAAPHALQLRLDECGHSPHRDQPVKTLNAVQVFLKNAI